MSTVFQQLAAALGPYLGGTEAAGFVLGLTVIAVFTFAMTLALGRDSMGGYGLWVFVGIGYTFVVLIEWWPRWSALFLVVLILAAKLFGGNQQPMISG